MSTTGLDARIVGLENKLKLYSNLIAKLDPIKHSSQMDQIKLAVQRITAEVAKVRQRQKPMTIDSPSFSPSSTNSSNLSPITSPDNSDDMTKAPKKDKGKAKMEVISLDSDEDDDMFISEIRPTTGNPVVGTSSSLSSDSTSTTSPNYRKRPADDVIDLTDDSVVIEPKRQAPLKQSTFTPNNSLFTTRQKTDSSESDLFPRLGKLPVLQQPAQAARPVRPVHPVARTDTLAFTKLLANFRNNVLPNFPTELRNKVGSVMTKLRELRQKTSYNAKFCADQLRAIELKIRERPSNLDQLKLSFVHTSRQSRGYGRELAEIETAFRRIYNGDVNEILHLYDKYVVRHSGPTVIREQELLDSMAMNQSLGQTGQVPSLFFNNDDNFYPKEEDQNSHDVGNRFNLDDSKHLQKLLDNIEDEEIAPQDRTGTPMELKITLLEHQKVGLSWLMKMEEKMEGGILADDMGLGKTIQALSIIVSSPSKKAGETKTNLIIAPLSLLQQWEREIESRIKPEYRLSVFIFHGSNKLRNWDEMSDYDVVLTSYGTLGSQYASHFGNEKTGTRGRFNSPFYHGRFYRVILDEAHSVKSKITRASKAVCRLDSTFRWCLTGTPMQNNVDELQSLIKFLRIAPYNDQTKFSKDISRGLVNGSTSSMQKLQVLIKSIMLRRKKDSKIDGKPILVLPPRSIELIENVFEEDDEDDYYRSLEKGTAEKVNKYLDAGTFNTNYSNILVLLLRLRQACCHPKLIEKSEMKKAEQDALNLAAVSKRDEVKNFRFIRKLSDDVVRRIKDHLDSDEDQTCPICMDVMDKSSMLIMYPCGHSVCRECFPTYVQQFTQRRIAGGNDDEDDGYLECCYCKQKINEKQAVDYTLFNMIHMEGMSDTEILAAKRLAEEKAKKAKSETKPGFKKIHEIRDDNDMFKDISFSDDSEEEEEDGEDKKIAIQEKTDDKMVLDSLGLTKLFPNGWISSTKITKCMKLIEDIKRDYPGEKIIIFSQFTSLLDMVEVPLGINNEDYLRFDGSMSANERNEAIIKFFNDASKQIMLISLKAGNVGLTLTCASHVIILDPFWNPYVEFQAMDRAHRIGQIRPVHVYRLLIKSTVEDRIMNLQEKKQQLIENALSDEQIRNVSRLNQQELLYLFGLERNI